MKNFLKFLLVFAGVILLYIYNNPDVIDKYKTSDSSADKDSIQSADTIIHESQNIKATDLDSIKVDSVSTDSTKKESVVADSL